MIINGHFGIEKIKGISNTELVFSKVYYHLSKFTYKTSTYSIQDPFF